MAQFKVTGLDVIRDQLKERGAKVEGTVNHTVNQALEILNLPSVENGDRRIQSLNYVDADKAEEYQLARAKAPAVLSAASGEGKGAADNE